MLGAKVDKKEFNIHLKKLKTSGESIEELYKYYYKRIVLHIGCKFSEDIAEDVAQEFFNNLVNAKNEYEYVEFPTAWVYKCSENIAKRKLQKENIYAELTEEIACEEVADEDMKYGDELYGDLTLAIKSLDKLTQEIIKMVYVQGYSKVEVAEILNIKESTIRQKHRRGIKKIKKF